MEYDNSPAVVETAACLLLLYGSWTMRQHCVDDRNREKWAGKLFATAEKRPRHVR
jgi:hypothetical protein